jgi:hypothetical protein
MILKDKIDFQGHFSVKAFKKDGSVEVYEDKNLIMDTARSNMAELVGGFTNGEPIDKFVLGNKGHKGTDILDYKKVGDTDGFVSTRAALYAEIGDNADNGKDNFVYEIRFDAKSNTASTTVAAQGTIKDAGDNEACEVRRVVTSRTCTYTITIPDYAGNKAAAGDVVAYTEAALYAGDDIFSMKTFPARVKEDTVKFEITWAIIF